MRHHIFCWPAWGIAFSAGLYYKNSGEDTSEGKKIILDWTNRHGFGNDLGTGITREGSKNNSHNTLKDLVGEVDNGKRGISAKDWKLRKVRWQREIMDTGRTQWVEWSPGMQKPWVRSLTPHEEETGKPAHLDSWACENMARKPTSTIQKGFPPAQHRPCENNNYNRDHGHWSWAGFLVPGFLGGMQTIMEVSCSCSHKGGVGRTSYRKHGLKDTRKARYNSTSLEYQ